jgi:hypothetical protein
MSVNQGRDVLVERNRSVLRWRRADPKERAKCQQQTARDAGVTPQIAPLSAAFPLGNPWG